MNGSRSDGQRQRQALEPGKAAAHEGGMGACVKLYRSCVIIYKRRRPT
jgi:hypothetical protein